MTPTKIVCQNIWKLFGPEPGRFLKRHAYAPTLDQIASADYVAAVRNVSLDVGLGEIFVIMGLSGSGKSTLVRCLSRLIEPTAGRVLLDGQDLLGLSEAALNDIRRHKLAMVFQHFGLLPHETVLGNVAFPLEIQGVSRAKREERAMEMIHLVGLAGKEKAHPRALSGGQQQRVGIARALSIDPEVLFLDEPFSALDPLIRREMQDELLRLQAVLQKTIIFITHDFDEAIRVADRIAIMRDGAVVQVGTPEELVLRPATDYVREFTRNVPRAKVLSVKAVMSATPTETLPAIRINQSDKVDKVAAALVDGNSDAAVVDDTGGIVGLLDRETLLRVLTSRF